MFKEEDFEDIRPFYDPEINQALKRIVSEPNFNVILEFLFPDQDKNKIKQSLAETYSVDDFQHKFMYPLVYSIVKKTSNGLSTDGWDQLTPGTPYLFLGNHRDIVLDSAFLQVLLFDNGHSTSEITFGSNLMINQLIVDLGKVNRMFKVIRGGNKIELLKNSQKLSAYLRYTITRKKVSIWIAQRPGRTKNGFDKTETGLLKMFNMSSEGSFADSFRELNIVPLVVSYEYEPCCSFKIKELLAISQNGSYTKKPEEDLMSIITGITQPKGRIQISIGRPVSQYIDQANEGDSLNDKITKLAELIDAEVYKHFKLWPNNYIAHDRLLNSNEYKKAYTDSDKETFLKYMDKEIGGISGDRKIIEEMFLKLYANPVINFKRINQ